MTKKKNKKCDKQKIFFAVKIIFLVLLILAIALYLNRTTRTEIEFGDDISKMIIRNPVVADQFYPGSNASLNAVIDEYFKNAQEKNLSNVKAIIVPHAGYIYSGLVAAEGFAQLDEKYDKVFIIATNHNSDARYSGISIANFTHYSTPLGLVKVSSAARKLLKENPDIFNKS